VKRAQVTVTPTGARRLRRGDPWCHRTDVASWPPGQEAGAIVDVVDPQKNPVGQAFAASKSPLALRLLTRKPSSEETIDAAFSSRRFTAALHRGAGRSITAYRLLHGEADLLPGLFVDRYGDALTLQTLSEGADARKAEWAPVLAKLTGARLVVCRDDASGRDFEGLPREKRILLGEGPTVVAYHEGENRFARLEDGKLSRPGRQPPARRRTGVRRGARRLQLPRRLRALAGALV
jgi:23S rRNA (cytosine1962-C5)-methyltransferase